MDHIKIEKIQAINRYKKQQLLQNIFLYSLTALTCSLFFSSPFWYPPLCTCMNVFLYISLPKISSMLFSSKSLFIVGNLIVVFLVGESMILSNASTPASDVLYDEYTRRSTQNLRSFSANEHKREKKLERCFEGEVKSTCEDGEEKEGCGEEKGKGEVETEDLNGEGKGKGEVETEDLNGEGKGKGEVETEDLNGEGKGKGEVETEDLNGEWLSLPAEELNKRADDFIARVNKQRQLEAKLYYFAS